MYRWTECLGRDVNRMQCGMGWSGVGWVGKGDVGWVMVLRLVGLGWG